MSCKHYCKRSSYYCLPQRKFRYRMIGRWFRIGRIPPSNSYNLHSLRCIMNILGIDHRSVLMRTYPQGKRYNPFPKARIQHRTQYNHLRLSCIEHSWYKSRMRCHFHLGRTYYQGN